jgi:hypothetical protein
MQQVEFEGLDAIQQYVGAILNGCGLWVPRSGLRGM